MPLDYFKDLLFDIINENERFEVKDIIGNDQENTFVVELDDGTIFYLKCSKSPL